MAHIEADLEKLRSRKPAPASKKDDAELLRRIREAQEKNEWKRRFGDWKDIILRNIPITSPIWFR